MLDAPKLESYLKESTDSKGARKHLRLQTAFPVLFNISKTKNTSAAHFRQCNSVDISIEGIAIEVLDLPKTVREKVVKIGTLLKLKIDLPTIDELIEFSGKVCWSKEIHHEVYSISKAKPYQKSKLLNEVNSASKAKPYQATSHDIIGINFENISHNDKISIVSYAVQLKRKQTFRKYQVIGLAILVSCTTVWGAFNFLGKKKIGAELEVSNKSRQLLKKEIATMIQKKESLQAELQETTSSVQKQLEKIKIQSSQLEKTEQELVTKAEQSAELEKKLNLNLQRSEKLKSILDSFEERMYKYTIHSEKDDIYVTDAEDITLVKDENFKKARKAIEDEEYSDAIYFYVEALKKHPEAKVGYSLLARALFKSGKKTAARKSFNKYLRLLHQQ